MVWSSFSAFLQDLGTMFYIVPLKVDDHGVHDSCDKAPDYMSKGIIFFFLFIGLEILYGLVKRAKLYAFKDTVMSISLGVVQQLIGLAMKQMGVVPYTVVYFYLMPYRTALYSKLLNMFNLSDKLQEELLPYVYFIIGMLGCDLAYYFMHRFAHEYHLLWMAHSVHHSGERYNFATALRQGTFQGAYSWVFYLPLAAIGLPPFHYKRHNTLCTLYQFWIHTEVIGVLWRPIELIFNTPSHHRSHHRPPGNCNYAGFLIIWDRIFGTFVSELNCTSTEIQKSLPVRSDTFGELKEAKNTENAMRRSPIYGLAKPLDSFHPIFANLNHYIKMWQISGQSYLSYLMGFSYIFQKRNSNKFIINTSFKTIFPDYHLFDTIGYSAFGLPAFFVDPTLIESKYDDLFIQDRNERESPHLGYFLSVLFGILFLFTLYLAVTILLPMSPESPVDSTLYFADYLPASIKVDAWLLKLLLCIAMLEIIPSLYPKYGKTDKSKSN
jgi:sterol desaturase/sphingolipid hydroxylase (fatty acid hydroxylase superfamily)